MLADPIDRRFAIRCHDEGTTVVKVFLNFSKVQIE
jgi:hypothetical protein